MLVMTSVEASSDRSFRELPKLSCHIDAHFSLSPPFCAEGALAACLTQLPSESAEALAGEARAHEHGCGRVGRGSEELFF